MYTLIKWVLNSNLSLKASIWLLISSICYDSCTSGSRLNKNPVKYFHEVGYLEGNEVLTFDDYGIFQPVSFVMKGDIIYVQNRGEEMICAINRVSNRMESLLKRGDGPGEALNIAYITPLISPCVNFQRKV